MPHAEEVTTNGEKHQSQFLNHLASLPIINDTLTTLKSNAQISKSISLAHQAQHQYLDPILNNKSVIQAHSYIHPYAARADDLGDKGLTKVEERFPLIKEDSATVRDVLIRAVLSPVLYPYTYAKWGVEWVNNTYAKEVKSHGGEQGGLVAHGKAVLTTGLYAVGESAAWARDFLGQVKKEGEDKAGELKEKVANGNSS